MKRLGVALSVLASMPAFAAGPGGGASAPAEPAPVDMSAYATRTDLTAIQGQIPKPAASLPPMEAVGGAIGTAGTYRPADARQPRITRSKTVTLASDGTASFDWTAQGALSIPVQVALAPVYTGSGAPQCWVTSTSATAVSIKCVLAQPQNVTLNALTIASTLGLNLFPYTGSVTGMQVGVIVLPAS